MRHLTVRNLSPKLARALERERKRLGTSLNQTVVHLLELALGVENGRSQPFSNGLAKLAGGWTDADVRAFRSATAGFEQIDPELWQ
jgi:hypothetical protein